MAIAERSAGMRKHTERFERLLKKPLILLFTALGLILGPTAVIETINQIEKRQFS